MLSKTYTFDGNLEGKEKVVQYSEGGNEVGHVKVSDDECWFGNLIGATSEVFIKGQGTEHSVLGENNVFPMMDSVMVGKDLGLIFCVNGARNDIINLSHGIWFMYQMSGGELLLYPTSLTTAVTEQNSGIQPISGDLIHLPKAELYELYLYSNSRKKFKITVDDTGTLKATEVTN